LWKFSPKDQSNENSNEFRKEEFCQLSLKDLPASVTVLRDANRIIYVVGTAHVSLQSAHDVVQVIRAVKPDTICLELCHLRLNVLAPVCNPAQHSSVPWFRQLCSTLRHSGLVGLFTFAIERFYRS
jgi:hypothetical protein